MIKNERLREAVAAELRDQREWAKRRRKEALEKVEILDRAASIIEPLGLDWFVSVNRVFVRVEGEDKAAFSSTVQQVAAALGESPDIEVRPKEYIAEFKEHLVQVYLAGASDCKVIETEETIVRKVLKPHPSCKAALAALEEVG